MFFKRPDNWHIGGRVENNAVPKKEVSIRFKRGRVSGPQTDLMCWFMRFRLVTDAD